MASCRFETKPHMEYIYTFEGIPPSNNKYIGRNAVWEYRKVKAYWEQLIACKCGNKPPEPLECVEITIDYYFSDRRRRDPDNYSGKMILDGLRKAGVIADDSFDNIPSIHYNQHHDKNKPRTVVTVKEVIT